MADRYAAGNRTGDKGRAFSLVISISDTLIGGNATLG